MSMLEVGDRFRKNPLSKKPGGVTVILEFKPDSSGLIKKHSYDKVKNPTAFINSAMSKNQDISRGWIKKDSDE